MKMKGLLGYDNLESMWMTFAKPCLPVYLRQCGENRAH